MEALDRHSFDRIDSSNNLNNLYNQVFGNNITSPNSSPNQNSKETIPETRDPVIISFSLDYLVFQSLIDLIVYQEWACSYSIIVVLCEWAVCSARWGEHRAVATAALLDRRQQQLLANPSSQQPPASQDHHGIFFNRQDSP